MQKRDIEETKKEVEGDAVTRRKRGNSSAPCAFPIHGQDGKRSEVSVE